MVKYLESKLPTTFSQKTHQKVKEYILKGLSFSILGLTASGISPFLNFIASQSYAYFIYIDIYELPEFTKDQFLKLLYFKITGNDKKIATFNEVKETLLALKTKRIVVIINKFDLLSHEFNGAFLGNFRAISHLSNGRINFIFGITKPYIEINPNAIAGSNMQVFSRYIYFPLYQRKDLILLLQLHSPELLKSTGLKSALELCGGHIQLLQLILRSETPTNLLRDPYIRLLLKSLLEPLSSERKKVIKRLAQGKSSILDPLLLHIGIIRETSLSLELFSPLLKDYLNEAQKYGLPPKEHKLFQLLKKSKGEIISKEQIFNKIWDDSEETTDWALDSVVYRLRKHPQLLESGFIIKNRKKKGYQLLKN